MRRIPDEYKLLIAGSGGQGIMFLGRVIAEAALREGRHVTYIRSYGAEMRGGTAYCMVRISPGEIASPVFEKASTAVLMNKPSLLRFRGSLEKDACVLVNSSLAHDSNTQGKEVLRVPLNEIAHQLGNSRVANVVALGALIRQCPLVRKDSLEKVFKESFGAGSNLEKLNRQALEAGWNSR